MIASLLYRFVHGLLALRHRQVPRLLLLSLPLPLDLPFTALLLLLLLLLHRRLLSHTPACSP